MGKNEDEKRDGAKRVINTLEMLQIMLHHERCQAAVEAAAAIVDIVATDDDVFAAILKIHREQFPEDSAETLRDAYASLVPILMHIAQNHETGARNEAMQQCG